MTRETSRARQANTRSSGLSLVRVTIKTVTPLVVTFRGTDVPGVKVPGITYTANTSAYALLEEPAVGPVFPIA